MIFGNLTSIVWDHYTSLRQETGLKWPIDIILLTFIFVFFPMILGTSLGYYVTIWSGFIAASAPVLSVLTGFSINTLILLMRYDGDGNHPYEQRTVNKTKEFTLYSILVGVLIIVVLVVGYILIQIDGQIGQNIAWVVSSAIYALIIHYFLTLLSITHRLWSLVHGEAI